MRNGSSSFKLGTAVAAFGIVFSSAAHAAPIGASSVDPLVSLSVFGTASSRAAVCAAGAGAAAATAATTAAAQAPAPGCVLPVLAEVPPPMVEAAPPVAVAAPSTGLGSLLPLIGIAALGGLAILLLENDEDDFDEVNISPI